MRLLHTADFHVGKMLYNYDRTPEIEQALAEILTLAINHEVDAIIVSGDLFDTSNPSSQAQKVLFDFFINAYKKNIPVVAISGNHDSNNRLNSFKELLGHVGATIITSPQILSLETRSGMLNIVAVPYINEKNVIRAQDELNHEEGENRGTYRHILGSVFKSMAYELEGRTGECNIIMGHLTMDGALLGHDQQSKNRKLDLINHYALTEHDFPKNVQYIALGHIHRHQKISDYPPCYYSGSIIELDFGEEKQEKRVNLVELKSGHQAQVKELILSSTKKLKHIRGRINYIERSLTSIEPDDIVKVTMIVDKDQDILGIKDRILQIAPHVLSVHLEENISTEYTETFVRQNKSLIELYEEFCLSEEIILNDSLREAFLEAQEALEEEQ